MAYHCVAYGPESWGIGARGLSDHKLEYVRPNHEVNNIVSDVVNVSHMWLRLLLTLATSLAALLTLRYRCR